MIDTSIVVNKKENPVLIDKVLQEIQKALTDNLSWLNQAFGKSYKLIDDSQDREGLIYPAAYIGNGEYVSLLPNDNFGNFSWFDVYDPQEITCHIPSKPQITFSGALVFWFNLNRIYEDDSVIYTEEIKEEIVRLLTTPGFVKTSSRLTINRIYERPENIYKGYVLDNIDNAESKFLMYPYAGLRIEFTITTRELC